MANTEELQKLGWHLSPEGVDDCTEDGKKSVDDVIRVALDLDLKDIGKKINETANKQRQDHFDGPYVLQIQKLRNVSAPKDNEESAVAPPLYKLILTDGQVTYPAIERDKIHKLSLDTPPGTKVLLRGKVPVTSGFLILNKNNCEILGGRVDKLVENWQLKRTLAHQNRYNVGSQGSGPPPFVPFGQRRMYDSQPVNRRDTFKSLDQTNKEKKIEDTEFEQQRQRTIAAITEVKGEQQGKVYGSGSMIKPADRDIASIVEMGFTSDQANAALKQNNNNLNQAVDALLNQGSYGNSQQQDNRGNRNNRNSNSYKQQHDRTDYNHKSEYTDTRNERTDYRNERTDYRNERTDYRNERTDYRNDRSDYRNERSDYRNDRSDYRNERSDYRNERSDYRNERSDYRNERQDYRNDRSDYRNERSNDYSNKNERSNSDYRTERPDDRRNDRQSERNGRVDRNERGTEKYDRNDRTERDRPGRNERQERGRGRRPREEDEDDEYRKGPSATATLFDFIVNKNPETIKAESKDEGSREYRARDSSKSSDNSDKRSVTGGIGPPNLPPRLVRQQRKKEEEARARRQGPPGENQRPPPPPPYAVQAQQSRQKPSAGPRHPYPDQMEGGPPQPPINMRVPPPNQQYPPPTRQPHPGGKRNNMYNNPNMRGPPLPGNGNIRGNVQNKTLWNDNDGSGGRRYNNYNRQPPEYDNRGYDRRGPNQRYNQRSYDNSGGPPPQRYDNNYYHQNRQYNKDSTQYSVNVRGGYIRHDQRAGYRRPQTNTPPGGHDDSQQEQEVVVINAAAATSSNQDLESAPEQSSNQESSEESNTELIAPPIAPEELVDVDGGVIASQGEGVEELESGYVVVDGSGAVVEEYIEGTEVMDPNAMVAIDDPSQTMYIQYEENGEVTQQTGGYVQVTPQSLVSPLQQMTLSGSGAPIQTYQYPGAGGLPGGGIPAQLVLDQSGGMYAAPATALYSPTDYNGQQNNTAVNGNKPKNNMYIDTYPNDSTGKPGRQWKPGDYCMAKYWEDLQYYRAIVHQVDPSGAFCYVQFPDYGNIEQVSVKDIRPVPRTAWDNNTLQMPVSMVIAPSSQPGLPGAVPPGILIQNPPPITPFISAYPGEQQYTGAVMSLPPGTVAYAPVVTTLATTAAQQQYSKQPAVQQVYVAPQQMAPTSHIITQPAGAPPPVVTVTTQTSQSPQQPAQQPTPVVTAMTQPQSTAQPVVMTTMTQATQPVVTVVAQPPPSSQAVVIATEQQGPTT